MRVQVTATVLCLLALAGCEQSYSTTRTVTEANGDVVERSVEFHIGDQREPAAAEKSETTPVEDPAPAAADTPAAPEG